MNLNSIANAHVRRRMPEWTEKEVECLMTYVEADDSETIYERLDFARYMLHYESGMDFPLRSMYDVKKKFYEECKRRRAGKNKINKMSNFFKKTKRAWEENQFDNGGQTPAYGNEKTASQMIIELQNKNATLRLALGKLTQLCKNTRMQERDEIWNHYIGLAIEAMNNTDPNGKWDGIRL